MKTIVMTTESPSPVNMDAAGVFETGVARQIDNDELADLLLGRSFPEFKEVTEKQTRQTKSTSEVIGNV